VPDEKKPENLHHDANPAPSVPPALDDSVAEETLVEKTEAVAALPIPEVLITDDLIKFELEPWFQAFADKDDRLDRPEVAAVQPEGENEQVEEQPEVEVQQPQAKANAQLKIEVPPTATPALESVADAGTQDFTPPAMQKPEQLGGIEILVQMAEKNEIDPKNIDIIDICDRFLKAIAAAPKENLRQSGKIIFHASVLLRMKAEALLVAKVEEDMIGDDFLDFDEEGGIIYDSNNEPVARQITLADLEKALVRRTKSRQVRHRRVTLEQLIEALREAERQDKERAERKPKAKIDLEGHHEMRDMDDILDLAHDEDIEDVISRIERLLVDLLNEGELIPLLGLIQKLGGHGDWVDAFLAVLFLSNAGKITLEQETFWGPLFIVRGDTEGQSAVLPNSSTDPIITH
jgi:segregation and condensation protein A